MRRSRYLLLTVLPGILGAGAALASPDEFASSHSRAFEPSANAVVKLYGGGIGREHGYGTGFLISADGQILTVHSLLTAGTEIRVVTSDGRRYNASVTRTDDARKLALLKIEASNLPFVEISRSAPPRRGDTLFAMGNWFKIAEGSEPVSLTKCVLSLKTSLDARRLAQEFEYRGPVLVLDGITANPGAPGGPVVDLDGKCVGIIGIVVESAATNTRLNYALPSEEIEAFLATKYAPSRRVPEPVEAARKGEPYLGIKLSKLGFRQVSAYIDRVTPGSPAATAGLRADDLIVSLNGRRIVDTAAFQAEQAALHPGQRIEIVVKRGNGVIRAELVVGRKP